MMSFARRQHLLMLLVTTLAVLPGRADAHGGVVLEDDVCMIKVGYLEAHFKIYLPRAHGHRDYCEDLPGAGETVFVMEYLHSGFSDAPIDFRIVRNETGLGRFAAWQDLADSDLEAITVFHQSARLSPDVFSVVHEFESTGEYIGIVTARHPDADKVYSAVFPFRIGFAGFGYWPWIAAFVLFLYANIFLVRRLLFS